MLEITITLAETVGVNKSLGFTFGLSSAKSPVATFCKTGLTWFLNAICSNMQMSFYFFICDTIESKTCQILVDLIILGLLYHLQGSSRRRHQIGYLGLIP